jgi:2-polyprenyl-3-methyl-5-hydroxy-6-metoxy-1,4-benzoquinol methylase
LSSDRGVRKDYELYNRTAGDYDRVRFLGKAGRWSHIRQLSALKQAIPEFEGKRILELGCGTGRITAELATAGAEVLATDISAQMIDVARERVAAANLQSRVAFGVVDVFSTSLDTRGFDYVLALNVVSRLTHPDKAIFNVARTLGDDACFVFSFNCLTSILYPFAIVINARGRSLVRNVTSRWHSPSTVERFAEHAGLYVSKWVGNHYVPSPTIGWPLLPIFQLSHWAFGSRHPKFHPSVTVVARRKR